MGCLIIASLFLFSCSSDPDEITLDSEANYFLKKGENNSEKTKPVVDFYELYINHDIENQLPLYKYILGENYKIFIGMVYNDIPKLHNNAKMIKAEGENSFYNVDSLYIGRKIITGDNKYVISFVSTDSSIIYKRFNEN